MIIPRTEFLLGLPDKPLYIIKYEGTGKHEFEEDYIMKTFGLSGRLHRIKWGLVNVEIVLEEI